MFDMTKIGRRIAELRREKNMTQMELSDRLGISHQAVSKWERGESMPDVSTLPLLAELFGVTVDHLLEAGGDRANSGASTLVSVLENRAEEDVERGAITLGDVVNVAPLLKPSQIDGMAEHFNTISVGELCGIAPFVSREVLDRLTGKVAEVEGIGELCGIAPFVSREVLDRLALKAAGADN